MVAAFFFQKKPLPHATCNAFTAVCCSGRRVACEIQSPQPVPLRRKNKRLAFSIAERPQPRFFLQENKMMMTPSAATIAAAVKPAVEISARE